MDNLYSELHRIFIGDQSPYFILEIVFRTTVIFLYTLLLLRFMGKRGMGQLTPFEFAIIVALGSAVGDPMFYPVVPLVHTMVVILVVILLHRLITGMTLVNVKLEKFLQGESRILIENGHINYSNLKLERLSKEDLFEMLRPEGISDLGQVKNVYLEPSGKVSIIRCDEEVYRENILPDSNKKTNDS